MKPMQLKEMVAVSKECYQVVTFIYMESTAGSEVKYFVQNEQFNVYIAYSEFRLLILL